MIIPSRSIRQMLANFSDFDFSKGQYRSSVKEKGSVFTSSTRSEIKQFHVAVVQRRQRKVQKSVLHVRSRCFLNFIIAFLPFSLPSGSPSSFLKPPSTVSILCLCQTVVCAFKHIQFTFAQNTSQDQDPESRWPEMLRNVQFKWFGMLWTYILLSTPVYRGHFFYHMGQFFETSGFRRFLRALYKSLNWRLACRTMARPVILTMKDSFSKIFLLKNFLPRVYYLGLTYLWYSLAAQF